MMSIKKIIIGMIILLFLCLATFLYSCNLLLKETNKVGLKNVIEQFWEGEKK